jgi:circadian clock protein KaiB
VAECELTLYVTEKSAAVSKRAIRNLRRICRDDLQGRCEMQVVDLLEAGGSVPSILVTPVVMRQRPLPRRWIFGDFSRSENVLAALELTSEQAR